MSTKLFALVIGDQEIEFYDDREEALDHGRQAVKDMYDSDTMQYADDVGRIFVAEIIAVSAETNVVERPPEEELDQDGCDADGIDWSEDIDYICDYDLIELEPEDDGSEAQITQPTIH